MDNYYSIILRFFKVYNWGMSMRDLQKRAYENKVKHGFNLEDINFEFCLLYGEVGEAYHAWLMKEDGLGSELADVGIFKRRWQLTKSAFIDGRRMACSLRTRISAWEKLIY